MKKFLAVAIMAASVSVGGVANVAAAPSAAVKSAARAVTVEQVYGPLYGHYKAKYPHALNWSNNGCSFPSWMYDIRGLGGVIQHYGGEFQKSCDRHDFGYRNHRVSGVARATVDRRFRDNMYHQCDVNHIDGLPVWLACRGAAKLIFEVVDSFGYRFW